MLRSALVALVVACAVPASAHAGVSGVGVAASEIKFHARFETYYTSNYFHVPTRRLPDFDVDTAQGERFFEMEGPFDVVGEASLGLSYRRRFAKRRDMSIKLKARYIRPVLNGKAAYFKPELTGAIDLGKHDRLRLDVDFIPTRFRKNYGHEVAGVKVFSPAEYLQLGAALSLRHEISKRTLISFAYQFTMRNYDDPFSNRDRLTHEGETALAWRALARLYVRGYAGGGVVTSPGGLEFGIPTDRSFVVLRGGADVFWDLRKGWDASIGGQFRLRDYITDETADATRFGRQDTRIKVDAKLEKKLARGLRANVHGELLDSNSNRSDPALDADEAGYNEVVVGLGLTFVR